MALKDYFHLDRQDRSATLLLIVLVVSAIGVYLLTNRPQAIAPIITAEDKEQAAEVFEEYIDSVYSVKYGTPLPTKLSLGKKIDINAADTNALKRIPGIGSAYANRIVDYRNKIGRIQSVAELEKVKGIKGKRLIKLSEYVYIGEKE